MSDDSLRRHNTAAADAGRIGGRGLMGERVPFYPGRAPIDAYGNGGFRFAQMSHRGSILCLPSGIMGWDVGHPDQLNLDALKPAIAEADKISVLLLGTGDRQVFLGRDMRLELEAVGFAVEPMSTGSAARTYNVLLAEERAVAAALIAVD